MMVEGEGEHESESEQPRSMDNGQKEHRNSNEGSVPLWKLLRYADKADACLMILGFLGAIGDGMSIPLMMGIAAYLTDIMGEGPSSPNFLTTVDKYSSYMLYLAVGVFFASFLEGYCWTRTGERQAARMRIDYLRCVLRQDVSFFDTQSTTTSEVVVCVSNDTIVIQDVLAEKLPNFLANLTLFLGSYMVSFYLAWELALAALPLNALFLVPAILYGKVLVGVAKKTREAYKLAGNLAQQALASIRTVYSFVAEDKTLQRFSEALKESLRLGVKQGLVKGLAMGSLGLGFCIWAFMLWYGSTLIMFHGLSVGRMFLTGANVVVGGIGLANALPNVRYFTDAGAAGKRLLDVVNRVPEIDSEDPCGQILDRVSGHVEFRNVEFSYPARPENKVLNTFCLQISAGTKVALVGSSGCGKSTVISLLQRFYNPVAGEILLDNVNIQNLQLKWMRSQMGLVSQEPTLFAMSIRDNILLGTEGATMDDVIAAAEAANAHRFISELPNGYDTQVGERGVQISGGQKQRIAIARAILKKPSLLLLDEATSALDSESEKTVQEALDRASVGKTTVIVAHRLSTVRNANLITVIQAGKVMEMGDHDDLVSRHDSLYADMVNLQKQKEATREQKPREEASMADLSRQVSTKSTKSGSARHSFAVSVADETELEISHSRETVHAATFGNLLAMNKPEWKQGLLGSMGAVLAGSLQPIFSFVLGGSVSILFSRDNDRIRSEVRRDSLIFFALGIVSFLVSAVQHYNFSAMGEYLTKRVRENMLSKILTFEIGWFDFEENSSGAICARLATEADVVKSLISDGVSLIVQTLSGVIIAYTMTLAVAWRLALVAIAVQPLTIIAFYFRKVILKMMSEKALKSQNEGSQIAAEAVSSHRTVTAFSAQEKMLELFRDTQKGPSKDNQKQSWIAGLVLAAAQCLDLCNITLIFWYGGHLIGKGFLGISEFFQTFLILRITGKVIAETGSMTKDIAKGSDTVDRLFKILHRKTLIPPDDPDSQKPEKIHGGIHFKEVDFAYPSRPETPVLKAFTLKIKAGTSMALVGQSGCGKSTIVGLIQRFYDPTKGFVRIDGSDIRSYNLRHLRFQMGIVGQEPVLFSGSIRENIAYGKENATEAETIEAAVAANAHEFIVGLQESYETPCGDRGVQLSGGQKQRIAIARAIIKNPSILLLDEATSALDSHAEQIVQGALQKMMVGRTTLVIAHRLSTVENCECIAVIDNGRVVELGSHLQLLSKGHAHPYFSLFHAQSSSLHP